MNTTIETVISEIQRTAKQQVGALTKEFVAFALDFAEGIKAEHQYNGRARTA